MENKIIRSCREDERSGILKIINFKLPHSYRKVGLWIGGLLMLGMLIAKISGYSPAINKDALRTVALLALLVASLSQEEFEDEYVSHIRGQSYIVAFVCALGYSIIIPLVAFAVDALIVGITGDGQTSFYEISSFEVMFMMICFQIMFFEVLKRLDRAE